jgi:hypothetical protein
VLCLAVILRDNGTGGISFKTHILYFIVFTARFSNVFFCLKLSWNLHVKEQKTKQREFPDIIPAVFHLKNFSIWVVYHSPQSQDGIAKVINLSTLSYTRPGLSSWMFRRGFKHIL